MPMKSTRLVFRKTTIGEALALGIEDLAGANYAEVELLQDVFPLRISWAAYQMAERRGEFFGVGAYCKGELVGYAGYTMLVPDHHADVKWAFNRVVYMVPAHRGWGSLELMEAGEALARDKGAAAVVQAVKEPHSTSDKRSVTLGELLVRKAYIPYERHYVKVLTER